MFESNAAALVCSVRRLDENASPMSIDWTTYSAPGQHDELVGPGGGARAAGRALMRYLSELGGAEIGVRQQAAELAIKAMGITFTVYHEQEGSIDRAWPLDIIPRTITRREWAKIEKGLEQRVAALNLFINDVYHEQRIVADGIFPKEIIDTSKNFRSVCVGIKPPGGCWAHICGSDLVRDKDGTVYVLEDNLRVPSGVSYMIENRQVVKRVFPELFESAAILPVDDYPLTVHDMLVALSPRSERQPEVVGADARDLQLGILRALVSRAADGLRAASKVAILRSHDDDCVYMQTIRGWTRVDVIYRRIDDDFLRPGGVPGPTRHSAFPGLMRAWASGNVCFANAPGAGVADDKLVYTYVPDMIKYYLDNTDPAQRPRPGVAAKRRSSNTSWVTWIHWW